ncbi:MAG: DUF481 domain-containing protein [Opitutales bacterium]|nr:DUF481 domain-containing protein [Opitutales bacterium]
MKRLQRHLLLAGAVLLLPLQIQADDEAPETFLESIEGKVELGYLFQSGRTDRDEISARLDLRRDVAPNEYRFTSEFLYGKQDGDKSSDRYALRFRWRHTFAQHFFTELSTSYEKDRIREIRHRAEQDFALGYRYINRDDLVASVGPGFTIQFEELQVSNDNHDTWNYLATVFQDVRWQFNDSWRLEQDSRFLIEPSDTDDFFYRFNLGLIGKMTEQVSLSVRYSLLYENQTPPDVPSTEQRLVTSLGYSF